MQGKWALALAVAVGAVAGCSNRQPPTVHASKRMTIWGEADNVRRFVAIEGATVPAFRQVPIKPSAHGVVRIETALPADLTAATLDKVVRDARDAELNYSMDETRTVTTPASWSLWFRST
ncbi:hypothetical protein [Sphingomonas faeni]|uniref:hypothetical protein n=1 Tax=Sphingomonas faeni TaxID=185950 RepID=UPI00334F58CD